MIQQLIDQATQQNKTVWLMVFKINPAQQLYRRLGFKEIEETETHYKMEATA